MNDTDFNGIKQNSHQMRIYCVRLSVCVFVQWLICFRLYRIQWNIYTHTFKHDAVYTFIRN